jgi:hypothetical protein
MTEKVIKIKKTCAKTERWMYEADPVYQPGSPIVGRGPTPFQALKDLLMNNDEFKVEIIDETGELK